MGQRSTTRHKIKAVRESDDLEVTITFTAHPAFPGSSVEPPHEGLLELDGIKCGPMPTTADPDAVWDWADDWLVEHADEAWAVVADWRAREAEYAAELRAGEW